MEWIERGNPLNGEHDEECECDSCHEFHDVSELYNLADCCYRERLNLIEDGEVCEVTEHWDEFMRDGICIECDPDFQWCGECGGFGKIEELACEFCEGKGYVPNPSKVVGE